MLLKKMLLCSVILSTIAFSADQNQSSYYPIPEKKSNGVVHPPIQFELKNPIASNPNLPHFQGQVSFLNRNAVNNISNYNTYRTEPSFQPYNIPVYSYPVPTGGVMRQNILASTMGKQNQTLYPPISQAYGNQGQFQRMNPPTALSKFSSVPNQRAPQELEILDSNNISVNQGQLASVEKTACTPIDEFNKIWKLQEDVNNNLTEKDSLDLMGIPLGLYRELVHGGEYMVFQTKFTKSSVVRLILECLKGKRDGTSVAETLASSQLRSIINLLPGTVMLNFKKIKLKKYIKDNKERLSKLYGHEDVLDRIIESSGIDMFYEDNEKINIKNTIPYAAQNAHMNQSNSLVSKPPQKSLIPNYKNTSISYKINKNKEFLTLSDPSLDPSLIKRDCKKARKLDSEIPLFIERNTDNDEFLTLSDPSLDPSLIKRDCKKARKLDPESITLTEKALEAGISPEDYIVAEVVSEEKSADVFGNKDDDEIYIAVPVDRASRRITG